MRFLITLAIALLLLIFESVIVRYLGLGVARIDVTVAIVAFLALRADTFEGSFSAFGVGYLLDVMSGQPTGLYAFLAVSIFLLGRAAASLVDVRTAIGFALFAMGADGGHGLLAFFLSWMVSNGGNAPMQSLFNLPLQVALTGLAALLMWPLLRKIDPGTDRPEMGLLR